MSSVASPWIYALSLALGAMSFATALAWNQFFKGASDRLFPNNGSELLADAIYAFVMLFAMILLGYLLATWRPQLAEAVTG